MPRKKDTPAKRALRMAGLGFNVAGSSLGYPAQRAFLNEDKREAKLKQAHGRAARHTRQELQSLKGPAMKLGQALSLQSGVLPEDALQELSKPKWRRRGCTRRSCARSSAAAWASTPRTSSASSTPSSDQVLIPVVLILLSMVAGGMAYPSLPELVTLRWGDVISEPLPRLLVALVVPLAALAVWLLLRGIASPAGERMGRRLFPAWFVSERTGATAVSRFGPTYDTIVLGTVSLLLLFHVAILAAALGAPSWTARAVTIVLGAGMMAVGNIMPRTRPNWVAGLRTRRTLADPDVWRRTHRWFGALLVVSGVAVVVASFVGAPVALAVAVAGGLVSAIVATIAGARGSDSGPSGFPAVLVVVFMTSAMPLSAQGPDTTPGARGFAEHALTWMTTGNPRVR